MEYVSVFTAIVKATRDDVMEEYNEKQLRKQMIRSKEDFVKVDDKTKECY